MIKVYVHTAGKVAYYLPLLIVAYYFLFAHKQTSKLLWILTVWMWVLKWLLCFVSFYFHFSHLPHPGWPRSYSSNAGVGPYRCWRHGIDAWVFTFRTCLSARPLQRNFCTVSCWMDARCAPQRRRCSRQDSSGVIDSKLPWLDGIYWSHLLRRSTKTLKPPSPHPGDLLITSTPFGSLRVTPAHTNMLFLSTAFTGNVNILNKTIHVG